MKKSHFFQSQFIKQQQFPLITTMCSEEDIWFVRHAQSMLNQASRVFLAKHHLPYQWSILSKNIQFLLQVKYNQAFFDCSISQTGRQQCRKSREITDTFNPDIILVSPMERTLETCDLLFSGRNIPIVAEPLLTQSFRASCDYSLQVQDKIQKYPHIDFDNVKREGDLWFLKNESQQNQKRYKDVIDKLQPNTEYNTKLKTILDFMIQTFIFEQPSTVRKRSWKIKQMLKKYQEKYQKIAVVAHYNSIKYTVAKQFNQGNEPINTPLIKNCEVVRANLNQMLKYQ